MARARACGHGGVWFENVPSRHVIGPHTGGGPLRRVAALRHMPVLHDSAWAFAGLTVSAGGALVLNAVLTRVLPPSEYGRYVALQTAVYVLAVVGRLGLDRSAVRLVAASRAAGDGEKARSVASDSVVLASFGAVALGVFSLVLVRAVGASWPDGIVLGAGIWLVAEALRSVPAEVHRGFADVRAATLFGDAARTGATLLLFLTVLIVAGETDFGTAVQLSAAATLPVMVLALLTMHRKVRGLPRAHVRGQRSSLLRISLPLMLFGLFANVLHQGDVLVASFVDTPSQVALYGAAVRLGMVLGIPFIVVQAVMQHRIAEMASQHRLVELEQRVRSAAVIVSLLTLVGTIIIIAGGESILGLAFGDFYRSAAPLLAILSAGHVANAATGLCQSVLIMSGHERAVMTVSGLAAITLIAGGLAAGSFFGTLGVAVLSSFAVAVEGVVMVWLTHRYLGVWTHVGSPRTLFK